MLALCLRLYLCAAIRSRIGLRCCLQRYGLNLSIRITIISVRVFRFFRVCRCRCGVGCRRGIGCRCRVRCRCGIGCRCRVRCRCRIGCRCGIGCRCRVNDRCRVFTLRESRGRHKRKRHCQQQAQQNKFAQFLVHTLPPIISAHFEFLNYVCHQMTLWGYCTMYERFFQGKSFVTFSVSGQG